MIIPTQKNKLTNIKLIQDQTYIIYTWSRLEMQNLRAFKGLIKILSSQSINNSQRENKGNHYRDGGLDTGSKSGKKVGCATSRCLDILMKHSSSCLII